MNRIPLIVAVAVLLPCCALAWGDPPPATEVATPETPPALILARLPGLAAAIPEARENLRISELTYERIRDNLVALRQQANADPDVLRDYSIYLETVRGMMHAHEQTLAALTTSNPEPRAAAAGSRWAPVDPIMFDPEIPVEASALTELDRELDEALATFDAFILEEQYEATRRMERDDEASSAELTNLAMEAAAAVERLREKGIEIDTKGEGQSGDASEGGAPGERADGSDADGSDADGSAADGSERPQGDEIGAPGEGDQEGDGGASGDKRGDGGQAEGSGSGASGSGDARDSGDPTSGAAGSGDGDETPPTPVAKGDRPPADDDDIVARQLREAAERETDPVLKEKLWQEYDKYKRSS